MSGLHPDLESTLADFMVQRSALHPKLGAGSIEQGTERLKLSSGGNL